MRVFISLLITILTTPPFSVYANQENSYSRASAAARIPPPPSPQEAPLKPNIAVGIAILTTIFFVIILILLYLKHCKSGNSSSNASSAGYYGHAAPSSERKNSGINRLVIESLPVFRFKSLRGHKDELECSVCLNRFEPSELLRLLPKCKHAFHVECVDTWLDSHSTCPLCRYRVHHEDILLIGDNKKLFLEEEEEEEKKDMVLCMTVKPRRVSGRHSSAEERGIVSEFPKGSVSQNRHSVDTVTSLDSKNIISSSCSSVKARKDGLLMMSGKTRRQQLEHRINIVWGDHGELRVKQQERWSDVHVSDLMYVRPYMQQQQEEELEEAYNHQSDDEEGNGRKVINGRSASEITGVSRFLGSEILGYGQRQESKESGIASRWLSWIYPNTPPPPSSSTTTFSHPHSHNSQPVV